MGFVRVVCDHVVLAVARPGKDQVHPDRLALLRAVALDLYVVDERRDGIGRDALAQVCQQVLDILLFIGAHGGSNGSESLFVWDCPARPVVQTGHNRVPAAVVAPRAVASAAA